MDLIIPLGPDIARFDDRNLYLRTSPEDMADALSRVGPADLRTIAQASPEVASAGLEAVIEALESSDTLASMERLLSLLDRIKSAARSYLTEVDEIYVGPVVATCRCDTYRPLTADERARIVAAVGDDSMAAFISLATSGLNLIETAQDRGFGADYMKGCALPALDALRKMRGVALGRPE